MAKKAAATKEAVDSNIILQLDPNTVLVDDNTRYNLKETRIQTLADSIVSQNGVIEPVEVEPLAEPKDGFLYRLTLGFYRHAAVKHLNTTQAAGLTLPAIAHITSNPTERLKRQLAENIERENQSPMDIAVAIKRLFTAGLPRIEIRGMFPGSNGTKKGARIQPMSNAKMNMYMSFLDLPKSVQEKIHQGIVGVGAAYQLTKVDKDKQVSILEKVESDRQKALEQEEKDEERFLTQQKKQEETQTKLETAKVTLQNAETKAKLTAESLEKQTALVTELFKASKGKHATAKDKKAADSAFNEAEKVRVANEKSATEAQKEYEDAQVTYGKLTEVPKPKDKPKDKSKAKAPISKSEVQQAAKSTGASTGAVPLNAAEMRKVVADMALPTGDKADDKVIAIGAALVECFSGITTPETLYKEMRKIITVRV